MFINDNIAKIFCIYILQTRDQYREAKPSSAHDERPRSLYNIKSLSKTTFLKGSNSYRLVSTFVRSRHQALTVRPYHQALKMINIYITI